jgi:hypothetical protein
MTKKITFLVILSAVEGPQIPFLAALSIVERVNHKKSLFGPRFFLFKSELYPV